MFRFEPGPQSEVLLICMPWASLGSPSLALGLLKAQLGRAGMAADVAHLNLLYAEVIGAETYERTKNRNVMASEWVFAEGIRDMPARDGYLSYLAGRGTGSDERAQWQHLRERTPEFVERCLQAIPWDRYKVVGFTTSMLQTVSSLRLATEIRRRRPQLRTVFGGANCEGVMGATLHAQFPQVDVIVRGEADDVAPTLFRHLLDGEALDGVEGICFRSDSGQRINPEPEGLAELTRSPTPDYGDYFRQLERVDYRNDLDVMLMFEGSRGCWWGERSHCKFCALNGRALCYREKPVDQILRDLKTMSDETGIRVFGASDNVVARRSLEALSEAVAAELPGSRVFYDVRPTISRAEMEAMSRAGILNVVAGLESLSTPVLHRMSKGTTGILNVRFLRRCEEFGLMPLWNFLYGFPHEGLEEYEVLLDQIHPWLHHLPMPDVAFALSLQRFSAYFEAPEEHGIEMQGALDDYDYIYGLDRETLDELAYYFKFRYVSGYQADATGGLVQGIVERWRSDYSARRCRLKVRSTPDGVLVEDTRTGEFVAYLLSQTDAAVYRLCESPISMTRLAAALRGHFPHAYLVMRGRVSDAVERLEDARLIYREDDKIVALAVPDDASFWHDPKRH